MSRIIAVDKTQSMWGTFDEVKEHLYNQFQNIQYELDTGLSLKDLENEVSTYLQNYPDHPKVLQKANIFRISLTHGQICIDPIDWFASNINHGNFINRIRDKWHEEIRNTLVKDEAKWSDRMYDLGVMRGGLDMHHIAPGWENMSAGGLTGLIEQIHKCRQNLGSEATDEQLAFYEAVEICYLAVIMDKGSVITLSNMNKYLRYEM